MWRGHGPELGLQVKSVFVEESLGPEVRTDQDFVQCGGECSTKCGRVTSPSAVSHSHVHSSTSATQTQILQCLAETAFRKKSKLMMFDVRRLAELLSDTSGILLSPSGPFLDIWSWLSTSLPCT